MLAFSIVGGVFHRWGRWKAEGMERLSARVLHAFGRKTGGRNEKRLTPPVDVKRFATSISSSSGGRSRTYDTRIMIPLL